MRKKFHWDEINAEFLVNSLDLPRAIPRWRMLKAIIERNPWHREQSVYDHTVLVVRATEYLCGLGEFHLPLLEAMRVYLREPIGSQGIERWYLLRLAAFAHDFGKGLCYVNNPDGTTSCPGHEWLGSAMIEEMLLQNFSLDVLAASYVMSVVRQHTYPHDAATLAQDHKKDEEKVFIHLRQRTHCLYPDLLLFHWADLLGCNSIDRSYREERLNLLKRHLELCMIL